MIPLEDNVGDIVGKAQRGLGVTNDMLLLHTGITQAQWRAIKSGAGEVEAVRKVAPALGLGETQLVASRMASWYPEQPALPAGFRAFNTRMGEMTVNSYLAWDPATRRGVIFDTGTDAEVMLAEVRREKISVELILLTHAHIDHVMELPKLLAATKARAWINARDEVEEDFPENVETFAAGQSFVLDALRIETRLTSGHAPGLTTFVVRGLSSLIAVVGDSIFAGSMGGSPTGFVEQLRNDKEQILTLPDATILACGHGPLTTVAQEKANNPFFAM